MARVIGFTNKVDGYRTRAGFMSSAIFTNACKDTARKLGVNMATLVTKRQAGKFLKGEGVVFNTAVRK